MSNIGKRQLQNSPVVPSKMLTVIQDQQMHIVPYYRCTVHSDIHTVHSPTDAHLLKLWLQFTLK